MPRFTSLQAALHREGRSRWVYENPFPGVLRGPPSLLCGFPHSLIVTLRQSFTVGPASGQPVPGKSWVSDALDIRTKKTAQPWPEKGEAAAASQGCL